MQAKNRRCSNCRKKVPAAETFVSQFRAFCSYECLKEFTSKNADKLRSSIRKQKRQEDAVRKENLKTRGQFIKEAQAAVNAYVRYRDRDRNCISCNRSLKSESLGGGYDAGHMLSRGAHSHKRFRTDNIHGQCKHCNRYLSGSVDKFRVGLAWRYGQEYVDRVEAHWEGPSMTIEYIKRIKSVFTRKLKLKQKLEKK